MPAQLTDALARQFRHEAEQVEQPSTDALNHAFSTGAVSMKVFQVRQSATGTILWTGSATDPIAALDAMAHEAGYYDHGDIPEYLRVGGLHAEEIQV